MTKLYAPPQNATKDALGAYIKEAPVPQPEPLPSTPDSIDALLERQMLALDRVTRQLVIAASTGVMTKDEIQSLSTVMKLTIELKERENELLDGLTEEQVQAALKAIQDK